MSNAKQMSLNEERIYDENQGRKKCKKSFMERAIWVNFGSFVKHLRCGT